MGQSTLHRVERRRIIERPRLLRLLDETDARIILLVAPAGYGKSTLARQWLAQQSGVVRYRVTDVSNDVVAFAQGLREAATESGLPIGDKLPRRLVDGHPDAREPSLAELSELLAEDLHGVPSGGILALDDYHALSDLDAEALLLAVADARSLKLVVASRRRPRWASGRRAVYGEVLEVGRDALTFSFDETSSVLSRSQREHATIQSLSRGWPAVIGLAALTRQLPSADEPPMALFDYFAEELFEASSPQLQEVLLSCSAWPRIDIQSLEHFFGHYAVELVADGVNEGYFAPDSGDRLDLHPLLRAFLRKRLRAIGAEGVARQAEQAADFFLKKRAWDSVFSIIEQFGVWHRLDCLLEGAVDDYLGRGRFRTLDRWVAAALTHGADSPLLDLVRAELAFRRGDHIRARSFAARAADGLDQEHPRYAQAWYRRGQAAQFVSAYEEAVSAYEIAAERTTSVRLRRMALWGRFAVIAESSGVTFADFRAFVDAYGAAGELATDDQLRLANARVILAHQRGDLNQALRAGEAVLPLEPHGDDPLIRSSFLNAMAYGLLLSSQYEAGLDVATRELTFVEGRHLAFAIPHALCVKAGCEIGMRMFEAATETLRAAEQHLVQKPDPFAEANLRLMQIKLLLAQRLFIDADHVAQQAVAQPSGTAVDDEIAALAALAFCVRGRRDEGHSLLRGRPTIQNIEVLTAIRWAQVALEQRPKDDILVSALQESYRLGGLDAFVVTYRAFPRLLVPLMACGSDVTTLVREVVARARDEDLMQAALAEQQIAAPFLRLSIREREVLELVRNGLSNREIATTLYITEATAKAHVRHILDKLCVRTRTEAAVMAARFGDDLPKG